MTKIKHFNGKPFILVCTVHIEHAVDDLVKHFRNQSHYVRTVRKDDGVEIWISQYPRWYYKWMF